MQVGFIIFFNLGNWRVAWGYWMALVSCISIQTVNAKQFMLICAIKCDKIQMFQTFLRKLIVITSRIQTERSTIIFFLCFKSTNVFWRIRFQKYGSFGRWALILKSPTGNRRVANQRSFSCRANHFNVKLLLLYMLELIIYLFDIDQCSWSEQHSSGYSLNAGLCYCSAWASGYYYLKAGRWWSWSWSSQQAFFVLPSPGKGSYFIFFYY